MKQDTQKSEEPLINGQPSQVLPSVSFKELFQYSTTLDKILIIIGVMASAGTGLSMPMFSVIFGDMTNAFSGDDPDAIVSAAGTSAIWFLVLSGCTFVLSFLSFSTLSYTGEKQSIQLRKKYFQAILRQEVGWFDQINPNELNTKIADETNQVEDAIKEKVGTFITAISTLLCGFIIGYVYGWQLSLVITASVPCLAMSVVLMTKVVMKSVKETQASYSTAAARSEEVLNAIRTVKMLDGEDYECQQYVAQLQHAATVSVKYKVMMGMALGVMYAVLIWTYALGFYYGAKLISDQTYNTNSRKIYTVGDVMTVFFSILMGSFSIGNAGPCFQAFAKGKVAGASIFSVINRIPKIQNPINPIPLNNFQGEIIFENVDFSYKQGVQVLNQCSLTIPKHKKIAFVGESGCGKSTLIQLIERFYDANEGRILIGPDQIDIREINLTDYRQSIGFVGQEPVLFAASIRDNLLFGKPDATEQEIIESLKKVNAWNFIQKMENGLNTYVGIGGNQLSGGQKQRIAIARAIIKQPKLLILDEATSALDRTNEKLIQTTLDKISQEITTITIAHRLSTVQNADIIYVFDKGKVIEKGNHNELMQLHGKYEDLAKNQIISQKVEEKKQVIEPNQEQQQADDEVDMLSMVSVNQFNQNNIVQEIKKEISEIKNLNLKIKTNQIEQEQQAQTVNQQDTTNDRFIFPRLFAYSKRDRPFLLFGLICAAINGSIFPCFSLFFSDMMTLLVDSNPNLYQDESLRQEQMNKVKNDSERLVLWFFLLGVGFLIFQTLENFFLSLVAENLTMKLRDNTFRKLLKMPIPFFDKPENNAGTFTARLSVDCKTVQSLTSTLIGFRCQNAAAIICGLSIAFSSSWALTLIVFGTAPLKMLAMTLHMKYTGAFGGQRTQDAFKESGNLVMESVTNIRTVYSFGNENIILNSYHKKIQPQLDRCGKKALGLGGIFGFSQMSMSWTNALVFYCGALLVKYYDLEVQQMFRTIYGILFATMGSVKDSNFVGDLEKGKAAARSIFAVLDSEDEYQIEEKKLFKRLTTPIKGNIQCKNISFKYPNREKNVFTNLSLNVPENKKVAFVGQSGCGKTTIMQMLMRFYDPDEGIIYLDGIDIRDYDIKYLRKQIAIVSQEPVLFNGTIKENIIYNLKGITINQLENITKQVCAYDFIMDNNIDQQNQTKSGMGFDKSVGPKGTQISGGQKQRIAVARALLRNTKILLLDEATSALDAKTEEQLQQALNCLTQTTVSIAHRISTIKDSDIIYVFDNGMIVEEGNYDQLISKQQYFYRMEKGIAIEEVKHNC